MQVNFFLVISFFIVTSLTIALGSGNDAKEPSRHVMIEDWLYMKLTFDSFFVHDLLNQ